MTVWAALRIGAFIVAVLASFVFTIWFVTESFHYRFSWRDDWLRRSAAIGLLVLMATVVVYVVGNIAVAA